MRPLETNSNTIIKLLEDEKRLRWKFNGPGLCCWARPSPSLPTRVSSLCSAQRQTTSHVTQKWDSSHPSWGPPGVLRLRPVASYGGERNNNDEAMPRGGRLVIIRLFVTITIMLSRSKIVVFLLALHDTTVCYFRPAPVSAIGFQFLFQSWVQESRS